MNKVQQLRFVWKPLVFVVCLIPAALVFGDTLEITGRLGANPIEEILDRFGNWGLRFVMIALAVTPLRRIVGWNELTRFRRMLGLFAFFYVFMHFMTWLVLDQGLMLSAIAEDLIERPFITLGFAALLLLTAMAGTSTARIRRRLGRRWQQLHYSVYTVGILGVWHYWWQVKADILEPAIYTAILSVLLGYRLWWKYQRPRRGAHPTAEKAEKNRENLKKPVTDS